MIKHNSYGDKPRLGSEVIRCAQGATTSASFTENKTEIFRNILFRWVNQHRKKLLPHVYNLGSGKISWAEAEEIVSELILEIQKGHFDDLLPKKELIVICASHDKDNLGKTIGCIYNRLYQLFISYLRWKSRYMRDFRRTDSQEEMLPSTLEQRRLDKGENEKSPTMLEQDPEILAMRKLLNTIKVEIYPELEPKDQAILDAIYRMPEGLKATRTRIYNFMTVHERLLFIFERNQVIIIDPKKIKNALYKRLQLLRKKLFKMLKAK